jgi:hypothetical protein
VDGPRGHVRLIADGPSASALSVSQGNYKIKYLNTSGSLSLTFPSSESRSLVLEHDFIIFALILILDGMSNGLRSDDQEEGAVTERLLGGYTNSPAHHLKGLDDLRTILFSGYINVLLSFLPFALLSGALEWSPTIVFVTNFFAMMPLAALLSFATEELSKSVGQGIGGLLNVTFGNATELIVGIIALKEGQVKLIQTTMLGSILSSLLFVIPQTNS